MRTHIVHTLLLILICTGLFSCHEQDPNVLPSLNETYAKTDKKPFGGYIAFHQLKNIFSDKYIETNNLPFSSFEKYYEESSQDSTPSLYILLAENLSLNDEDAEGMEHFIERGNDLFIAADYIDLDFLDMMGITSERNTELVAEMAGIMRTTRVKLLQDNFSDPHGFQYFYFPMLNSFTEYDTAKTRVLGFNEEGKPNLIVHFRGKGRLFLSISPRSFSNYFLLKNDNYKYLDQLAGYFRAAPNNIYWDEYYKSRRYDSNSGKGGSRSSRNRQSNDFSALKVIKNNPPLNIAFWLFISLLILFVLFHMKRKQRIVKEIKPNINTTVAFTESIGRLYLQKKNNKNISEKMITYFYDHIRNSYFLNTNIVNDDFITTLSRKSGVSRESTDILFRTIQSIQHSQDVEDFQILSLYEQIQNFYKTKN